VLGNEIIKKSNFLNFKIAVKMTKLANKNFYEREVYIYKKLKGLKGVPKIINFGKYE
jgi:hypothetical protein